MTELPIASLDGTIGPAADTQISVTDEGLIRGDGVFEVIRLYDGVPFALADHYARLQRSADNLRLPVDHDALAQEVQALLAVIGDADSLLRIVCTRGGRRLAMVEPLPERPPVLRLATITYAPTRVLDQVKSLSYAANMLVTRLAKEAGADEALLVTPHGRVLEGPTSTFFYVVGGELRTPPLSDHILDSITRRRIIEIVDVTESETSLDDVFGADEAFLASTLREVHPIVAIDEHELDANGPVTAATAAAVRQRISDELAAG
jgi:branched-chain amino acid aminotransferase